MKYVTHYSNHIERWTLRSIYMETEKQENV